MTAISDSVPTARPFGGTVRLLTVVIAIVVVAMTAARWLFPDTAGTVGMQWAPASNGQILVEHVDPGLPASALGLQKGDVIRADRMTFADRAALWGQQVAGVPFEITFERDARLTTVRIVPARLATWSRSTIGAFTNAFAVLYLGLALLVAWKAARSRAASLIIAFTLGIALVRGAYGLTAVLPSATANFAAELLGKLSFATVIVAQFLFVVAFPPRRRAAPRWTFAIGLAITIATTVAVILGPVSLVAFPALAYVASTAQDVLLIVYSLTVVVIVVEGAMSCEPAYRLQSLVAGSTLILLSAVNIVFGVVSLNHWKVDPTWLVLLQYAGGIGVTYAVLRHRLVDLNLIISRAAIFSVVSLVLICLFVITEWALALVLERAIGPKFGVQGQMALTGIIALCVGLSARNIHSAVERQLNRVFFARRYRALAELQRFAHETDAATDADALVDLTFVQLRRNLDATYVAIYTGRPETGYIALQNSAPMGRHRLDQNDELVLRLRRWGESFVNEIPGDVFGESLICPMMLRGTLYGFAVCGAKHDRTSYLPDERETLESLFHRVGIAYEWLTRQSTPAASGRLRALSKERLVEDEVKQFRARGEDLSPEG